MTDIVQRDHPVLRRKAEEVPTDEIGSDRIQRIINKMKTALHSQKDGVAIAATQIGEALRIFVVNGELLKKADKKFKGNGGDMVFINPKITKLSKDRRDMEEGCLSVRWLYGRVKRANKASITAYDEHGKTVKRGASGLLAQIFQHECDHLEGILFTDKAEDVWEMTEKEIRELSGKNE